MQDIKLLEIVQRVGMKTMNGQKGKTYEERLSGGQGQVLHRRVVGTEWAARGSRHSPSTGVQGAFGQI